MATTKCTIIRHVKCDEGKPKCNKCSTTGRICDNYNPKDEAIVLSQHRAQTRITILPGLGSTRSSKEHRYFEQFRQRAMYENAQNNHEKALEHLENGLRVYNVWAMQDVRPAVKQAQENILEIITRFDVQATSFWDSRKPILIPNSNSNEPECGDRFSALHAASLAQQYYELRVFYVLTAVSPKSSRRERTSNFEAMFPHQTKLLHSFNIGMLNWKRAFDGLCQAEAAKWSASEIHRSLLLQLHYQSLSLVVDLRANSRVETDLLPASENQRFQAIIDISRSVITHAALDYGDDFLTADGGVIAPLYFIAVSAPNTHLYQQAIDLLRMVKKREGFWQASAVLKVAEKVAERRREGTGAHLHGGVLELADLADVKFRTELFPENEGEVEARAEYVYDTSRDTGLSEEIAKSIAEVSCEEHPFRDNFEDLLDSLGLGVDGISVLSS
ncbi:hypothetical protein SBOR_5289 [Sclerotinia borealis F-4128]|uniref:Zn(2)-C6 fungal-type domain-containing protein n=1 Tax=Sclerotinia borealis (strain F-4128) TaxID=1432307 RepID=W9CEL8_SCLBF|nr:hypothetical protein SBOR_5289 [Sclerotinia borealis F-4128]